ncbi:hypothetical protein EDB87DRAFT_689925 [Lactarius vividus]|nr:hypothetical protein EDB87DRAFT_689925 [Lactarius vividus]
MDYSGLVIVLRFWTILLLYLYCDVTMISSLFWILYCTYCLSTSLCSDPLIDLGLIVFCLLYNTLIVQVRHCP